MTHYETHACGRWPAVAVGWQRIFRTPSAATRSICPNAVRIASIADDKVYGLLLGAPDAGCRRVRYRVETEGRVLLGKTPALAAGEVAVVRIGKRISGPVPIR